MNRRLTVLALLFSLSAAFLFGQAANGKLQIHFIDVGQGDGAILISPLGETVLFDNGPKNDCDRPRSYLQQLGLHTIDYQIASHFHADHIGCTAQVLTEFPLQKLAFDRGTSIEADVAFDTQATYLSYVAAVGAKRRTATAGTQIKLDAASANPVTIDRVAERNRGALSQRERP